jgi:hypothetical protein
MCKRHSHSYRLDPALRSQDADLARCGHLLQVAYAVTLAESPTRAKRLPGGWARSIMPDPAMALVWALAPSRSAATGSTRGAMQEHGPTTG